MESRPSRPEINYEAADDQPNSCPSSWYAEKETHNDGYRGHVLRVAGATSKSRHTCR